MAKDKLKVKEKKKRKILQVKKTSFFWAYFVLGGIVILLSLFFAPFWKEISEEIPWANWYSYALGGLVAGAIFLYMFTILLKKLRNKELHRHVRIIFGVEFSLLAFFAICSIIKAILNDNEKFDFLNACEIIGLVLWVRGCVEMFNAYYYDRNSTQKYPIWYLSVNIGLITVGPLILATGIIYRATIDLIVSYAFCSLIFILGVFSCVWGGLSKPVKVKEIPVEEASVELLEVNEEKKEETEVELIPQEENSEETSVEETQEETCLQEVDSSVLEDENEEQEEKIQE